MAKSGQGTQLYSYTQVIAKIHDGLGEAIQLIKKDINLHEVAWTQSSKFLITQSLVLDLLHVHGDSQGALLQSARSVRYQDSLRCLTRRR